MLGSTRSVFVFLQLRCRGFEGAENSPIKPEQRPEQPLDIGREPMGGRSGDVDKALVGMIQVAVWGCETGGVSIRMAALQTSVHRFHTDFRAEQACENGSKR